MSGQITRKSGEVLFLQAQLSDGEESLPLRIIADLLDGSGLLLKTVELSHTGKGVFVESSETMPNEPNLKVKYYVYELNGTTLKSIFGVTEDNYMLESSLGGGESSGALVGTIIKRVLSSSIIMRTQVSIIKSNYLEARIDSSNLKAEIIKQRLLGEISCQY